MSYLQSDFLIEKTYEKFLEEFLKNNEFEDMIHMIYFTHEELWSEKELGKPCEEALERIFNWLIQEDLVETCKNPVNVAWFLQKAYKEKK